MPGLFDVWSNLPRCEFYARFGSGYQGMDEPGHWNTYHRSRLKRRVPKAEEKGNEEIIFLPEQGGSKKSADKTGAYINPYQSKALQGGIHPRPVPPKLSELPGSKYDAFLTYQHGISDYITRGIQRKIPGIKANADNHYPGVLIMFPIPTLASKKQQYWANFVILYFVAIADYMAMQRGVNGELVRRSSFSHIRPTIAETAPSIRISVGLIPKVYADVLIDAASHVYALLCHNPAGIFDLSLDRPGLKKTISDYNTAKKLKDDKAIRTDQTLWQALWSRFDSVGKCLMCQLLRKESNVELLINKILDGLIADGGDLTSILANHTKRKAIFVTPWDAVLDGFSLINNSLSLDLGGLPLKTYTYPKESKPIIDEAFWAAYQLLVSMGPTIFIRRAGKRNHDLSQLHSFLERTNLSINHKPFSLPHEDGYGSDSDEEGTLVDSHQDVVPVSAKKLICATGMRGIQLAFAAIKVYCTDTYQLNFSKMAFQDEGMYYETGTALKKHGLSVTRAKVNQMATRYMVTLYDLNHCNTEQVRTPALETQIKSSFRICIIDSTSSTQKEMADCCEKLFGHDSHITSIIFVSSFKNEQGGGDLNPYGTIRIFSKNTRERDALYRAVRGFEDNAGYKHPAKSHLLRKSNKANGWTPTNRGIMSFFSGPVVEDIKGEAFKDSKVALSC